MKKPLACWEFYTYKPDFTDWVINRVTGGDGYSHCGIGFNFDDGTSEYWEAHWGSGFVGRKQTINLQEWQTKQRGRRLLINHLRLMPSQCDVVLARCIRMTQISTGYGKSQIAWMYLRERLGVRVPRSPRKLVCSEALSRALDGFYDRHGKRRHDEVTPNSAYRLAMRD